MPYPDFPLTWHPSGTWCKKIRGMHDAAKEVSSAAFVKPALASNFATARYVRTWTAERGLRFVGRSALLDVRWWRGVGAEFAESSGATCSQRPRPMPITERGILRSLGRIYLCSENHRIKLRRECSQMHPAIALEG
jgi:hypothetical protein